MLRKNFLLVFFSALALAACGGTRSLCAQEGAKSMYLSASPNDLPTPTPLPSATPVMVEIGGRKIAVDKVVSGALCHDHWSGTVYVTCEVQVYPWVDSPLFLKDCDLEIEPGTVVYVAYHNNSAYYQGCSCHTGELTNP